MYSRIIVLIFFVFASTECGPRNTPKIRGKNKTLPNSDPVDDSGFSQNLMVQCLSIAAVFLLSSNILTLIYWATRKPKTVTMESSTSTESNTKRTEQIKTLKVSEDKLPIEPLVQDLLAAETVQQKTEITESICKSIRDSTPTCYHLLNDEKFMACFLKLFEADDAAILHNCARITSHFSREQHPNLFMIERRALVVKSGLLDSVFNLFWKNAGIETFSLAAAVVDECIDMRSANKYPDPIEQFLKVMDSTLDTKTSSDQLSMLNDMNQIIQKFLTESTNSLRNAYTFVQVDGIRTYLNIIRSRTDLSLYVTGHFFSTVWKAIEMMKSLSSRVQNREKVIWDTLKHDGWQLALQFVNRCVREWKDSYWEVIGDAIQVIRQLAFSERLRAEIFKLQSFESEVLILLDCVTWIVQQAGEAIDKNTYINKDTVGPAIQRLCHVIHFISQEPKKTVEHALEPRADMLVGVFVRLIKALKSQKQQPKKETYEAILSILAIAALHRKGQERILHHWEELIIDNLMETKEALHFRKIIDEKTDELGKQKVKEKKDRQDRREGTN